jgi:hypothetical protein
MPQAFAASLLVSREGDRTGLLETRGISGLPGTPLRKLRIEQAFRSFAFFSNSNRDTLMLVQTELLQRTKHRIFITAPGSMNEHIHLPTLACLSENHRGIGSISCAWRHAVMPASGTLQQPQ